VERRGWVPSRDSVERLVGTAKAAKNAKVKDDDSGE
jgi:hypothetical protein